MDKEGKLSFDDYKVLIESLPLFKSALNNIMLIQKGLAVHLSGGENPAYTLAVSNMQVLVDIALSDLKKFWKQLSKTLEAF